MTSGGLIDNYTHYEVYSNATPKGLHVGITWVNSLSFEIIVFWNVREYLMNLREVKRYL